MPNLRYNNRCYHISSKQVKRALGIGIIPSKFRRYFPNLRPYALKIKGLKYEIHKTIRRKHRRATPHDEDALRVLNEMLRYTIMDAQAETEDALKFAPAHNIKTVVLTYQISRYVDMGCGMNEQIMHDTPCRHVSLSKILMRRYLRDPDNIQIQDYFTNEINMYMIIIALQEEGLNPQELSSIPKWITKCITSRFRNEILHNIYYQNDVESALVYLVKDMKIENVGLPSNNLVGRMFKLWNTPTEFASLFQYAPLSKYTKYYVRMIMHWPLSISYGALKQFGCHVWQTRLYTICHPQIQHEIKMLYLIVHILNRMPIITLEYTCTLLLFNRVDIAIDSLALYSQIIQQLTNTDI